MPCGSKGQCGCLKSSCEGTEICPACAPPTAGGSAAVKPKAGSDASKDRDATDKGEGPKRKSNGRTGKKNLSSDCVATLKEWYDKHTDWPYPATSDKVELAKKTGMQEETVNNWFINARKRLMNAKDREKLVLARPPLPPLPRFHVNYSGNICPVHTTPQHNTTQHNTWHSPWNG
jgi:hypothetical protein